MPFYEYRCEACQHMFDIRQSFSDDPIAPCPKCGAAAHRVIQPVGVVFKGGGWYATDSRRSSSHTLNGNGDSHDENASDSSDSSSPSTKEATKETTPASTTSSGDAAPSP